MPEDKEKLKRQKEAGIVAKKIFQQLQDRIKPDINILELEKIVSRYISNASMKPAFLGYNGYPSSCCICVNDEVVHAIPKSRMLKNGDVVTVDLGIENNSWIIDAARTYPVGQVKDELARLIKTTQKALDEAIRVCYAGVPIRKIGEVIESIIEKAGFYIVRELTGHGVGKSLQESPSVANFSNINQKAVLEEGQSIAIEPIICLKKCQLNLLEDSWTIVSSNKTPCVQIEDTIYVKKHKSLILTR